MDMIAVWALTLFSVLVSLVVLPRPFTARRALVYFARWSALATILTIFMFLLSLASGSSSKSVSWLASTSACYGAFLGMLLSILAASGRYRKSSGVTMFFLRLLGCHNEISSQTREP
jgi:hypothetical protein